MAFSVQNLQFQRHSRRKMWRTYHQNEITLEPPAKPNSAPTVKVNGYIKAESSISFRENLHRYFNDTTLHGLRYIGDQTLTWFERIFFVCVFVAALSVAIYTSSLFWRQWSSNTIITLSAIRTPLSELPFPAVTVCNTNFIKKSAVRRLAPNSLEHSIVQDICRYNSAQIQTTTTWSKMRKVLRKVSQPCHEMMLVCEYGAVQYNCSQLFELVVTDSGVCCRFNGIRHRDLLRNRSESTDPTENLPSSWSMEDGFSLNHNPNDVPRPFVDSGAGFGLRLTLNANTTERYCSFEPDVGYKVLVHEPHIHPLVHDYTRVIPYEYVSRVVISPFLLKSMKDVQNIPVEHRKCLFQQENPLEIYGTYSEQNCRSECGVRRIFSMCGCTMFHTFALYSNATICNKSHMSCISELYKDGKTNDGESLSCGCLPACWESQYATTLSSSRLLAKSQLTKMTGLPVEKLAAVDVFFVDRSARSYVRSRRVTFTDFVSSIGGILSLFLGFSLISIAELVYFIMIRPYCVKRHASNHDSRAPKNTPSY